VTGLRQRLQQLQHLLSIVQCRSPQQAAWACNLYEVDRTLVVIGDDSWNTRRVHESDLLTATRSLVAQITHNLLKQCSKTISVFSQ